MTHTAGTPSAGEALRAYLETSVIPSLGHDPESVARVRREPSRFASSYRAEVVTVELASGETLALFLKDFGESAFRKDGVSDRRERELHVYRDLLPHMELGTAKYYGSMWDEPRERFWLLLEFVEGDEVRFCPFEDWVAAAGWIGRLHGTGRWSRLVDGSPLLTRHDEAYFEGRAELAARDVARFGPALADRLRRVLDSYAPVVETMTSQPSHFIHGAYRAANVLRARTDAGRRICPLDWELAAIGSPLHDVAVFVDGFEGRRLDRLLGAYTREALAHGAAIPSDRELRQAIDCFRLHRVVHNLGRAERSNYGEPDVAKLVGRAEAISRDLKLDGARRGPAAADPPPPAGPPELLECLSEVFAGRSAKLVARQRLKEHVHRLRLEVDGDPRSLVAKWSDPAVARRCWLVARRWLPAAGLDDLCAPLLAVVAARGGDGAWHVYEDLGGRPLATDPPVRGEVEAAIGAIARVHVAFAGHRLLPECRVWGGDRGMHFYSAGLRDADIALRSLDSGRCGQIEVPAALRERIERLRAQEPERARAMAAASGPETLVHGDLWPTNAIVMADGGDGPRVRLVDWDEAAVGPVGFDLSTLLLRFDPSHRGWILDSYRDAVGRAAGWALPPDPELNAIFETAAQARLLSLLVWSVAAAGAGGADWLPERLESLVEWLDEVEPVLPGR